MRNARSRKGGKLGHGSAGRRPGPAVGSGRRTPFLRMAGPTARPAPGALPAPNRHAPSLPTVSGVVASTWGVRWTRTCAPETSQGRVDGLPGAPSRSGPARKRSAEAAAQKRPPLWLSTKSRPPGFCGPSWTRTVDPTGTSSSRLARDDLATAATDPGRSSPDPLICEDYVAPRRRWRRGVSHSGFETGRLRAM